MPRQVIGHAIVSVDGKIASADGTVPQSLRNAADWQRFQAHLDASDLVVLGRQGHERNPNPGRQRLVATTRVANLAKDPNDTNATLWNPSGIGFAAALSALGHADGTIAVAGVFDLFCSDYTGFDLAEIGTLLIRDGLPCFSSGHPRLVLANHGLMPARWEVLDAAATVTLTSWTR
jgi:hypothetical protein